MTPKKAVDYEVPAGVPDNRSASEIEADLNRVRNEMTATVNELATRLSPANLANEAKAGAKAKFSAATDKVKSLAGDAKRGDTKAIAIFGVAALAVVGLIVRKILR